MKAMSLPSFLLRRFECMLLALKDRNIINIKYKMLFEWLEAVQSKVRMAFKKAHANANVLEPKAAQVAEGMSRHSNLGNARKVHWFKCITMREAIHMYPWFAGRYPQLLVGDFMWFPNLQMILACTNCWVEMVCLTMVSCRCPGCCRFAQPMLSTLAMPWWRMAHGQAVCPHQEADFIPCLLLWQNGMPCSRV